MDCGNALPRLRIGAKLTLAEQFQISIEPSLIDASTELFCWSWTGVPGGRDERAPGKPTGAGIRAYLKDLRELHSRDGPGDGSRSLNSRN